MGRYGIVDVVGGVARVVADGPVVILVLTVWLVTTVRSFIRQVRTLRTLDSAAWKVRTLRWIALEGLWTAVALAGVVAWTVLRGGVGHELTQQGGRRLLAAAMPVLVLAGFGNGAFMGVLAVQSAKRMRL